MRIDRVGEALHDIYIPGYFLVLLFYVRADV